MSPAGFPARSRLYHLHRFYKTHLSVATTHSEEFRISTNCRSWSIVQATLRIALLAALGLADDFEALVARLDDFELRNVARAEPPSGHWIDKPEWIQQEGIGRSYLPFCPFFSSWPSTEPASFFASA